MLPSTWTFLNLLSRLTSLVVWFFVFEKYKKNLKIQLEKRNTNLTEKGIEYLVQRVVYGTLGVILLGVGVTVLLSYV